MRIFISVLLAAIAVGSAALAVQANAKAIGYEKALNEERYLRMVAEESLQEKTKKVDSLNSDLARQENKVGALQKQVDQITAINDDLKARLDKAAKIKEDLDRKIAELRKLAG